MANAQTLSTWTQDRLDQVQAAHRRFLAGQAGGQRAILAGADLSGLDLGGQDWRDADFSGCDLTGLRLDGADLSGARLAGASLKQASLIGCGLEGADLRGANLDACRAIACRADGADFRELTLPGPDGRMVCRTTRLNGADFAGASLAGPVWLVSRPAVPSLTMPICPARASTAATCPRRVCAVPA